MSESASLVVLALLLFFLFGSIRRPDAQAPPSWRTRVRRFIYWISVVLGVALLAVLIGLALERA